MSEQNYSESEQASTKDDGKPWERDVLEKLAFAALDEQKRARRWGMLFKVAVLLYVVGVSLVAYYPFSEQTFSDDSKHTAVVDVNGVIFDGSMASAQIVIKGLRAAVKNENTQGLIVQINSPGGSAVQADYIFKEIRRLKGENPHLPIHAVVTDVCASGGYYIAAAADQIFVNPASLVGSIGVIMNGFGFVSTMEKLGVERRLLVAGEHKALLDPFSPVVENEKDHVQDLLNNVHAQFINAVKKGRGDRLKSDSNLFSGLLWTGAQSIELGLADAEGDIRSVARDVVGAEKIVNFTPEESVFDLFAHKFGTLAGRLFHEMTGIRMQY